MKKCIVPVIGDFDTKIRQRPAHGGYLENEQKRRIVFAKNTSSKGKLTEF